VPNGGRYDGALGCVGALEVAATIAGSGVTPARPLEVVVWSDEEGWRFSGGFFGSTAFAGTQSPAMLEAVDAQGTSIGEALQGWGLDRGAVGEAARHSPVSGYLELHIEQGPVLESRGLALGVVGSIVGLVGLEVQLEGRAGHAGTVPMALRADALCAAAEAVLACERIARAADGVTATVGQLRVRPGAKNVIPGECDFSVDLRSADAATLQRCHEEIREAIDAAARRRSVRVTFAESLQVDPVTLSERLMATLERACARRGQQAPRLGSGAGHDAMILAGITEAAMLFVRCRAGISHNPAEYSSPEDNAIGVQALLDTALNLCSAAS
jgi:allantoate deiminase